MSNHNMNLKCDEDSGEANSFASRIRGQQPAELTAGHKNLEGLRAQTPQNSATQSQTPRETSDAQEIEDLNKIISFEAVKGFEYKIVPETYIAHSASQSKELSYSSEEELKVSRSNISTTSDWSSWNAESSFSVWGVSVAASGGWEKSSTHHSGERKEKRGNTKTAIFTRTAFHQKKKFKVRVSLTDEAVDDVKKILDAEIQDNAIDTFNQQYCSFVYTGPLIAGGWFRTTASSISEESMDFSALEREAKLKTGYHWAASGSGYGGSVGAGMNVGNSSHENTMNSNQSSNSSITVSIVNESQPGLAYSENALYEELKDPVNWTIFPIVDASKENYTHIHEIIKIQACETEDEKLGKAADVLTIHKEKLDKAAEVLRIKMKESRTEVRITATVTISAGTTEVFNNTDFLIDGAGFVVAAGAQLTLINCTVRGLRKSGYFIEVGDGSNLVLLNCEINSVDTDYYFIWMRENSCCTIFQCKMKKITAATNGVVWCYERSKITVYNTLFEDCTASRSIIQSYGAAEILETNFTNCKGGDKYGVVCSIRTDAMMKIQKCTFHGLTDGQYIGTEESGGKLTFNDVKLPTGFTLKRDGDYTRCIKQ